MHIHELKHLGADLVKLLKLDLTQHFDVAIAPFLLGMIIHSLGLAKLVLHGADNVLCNLAHINGVPNICVWRLSPLCYERIQISFALHIWKWVACQRFSLFQNRYDQL